MTASTGDSSDILGKDGLQTQDSFGKWMNYIMTDTPGSLDDSNVESSISTDHESFLSPMMDHLQSPVSGQIFSITDVSPAWAFSTEETKVLSCFTTVLLSGLLVECTIFICSRTRFLFFKWTWYSIPCFLDLQLLYESVWYHILQIR